MSGSKKNDEKTRSKSATSKNIIELSSEENASVSPTNKTPVSVASDMSSSSITSSNKLDHTTTSMLDRTTTLVGDQTLSGRLKTKTIGLRADPLTKNNSQACNLM